MYTLGCHYIYSDEDVWDSIESLEAGMNGNLKNRGGGVDRGIDDRHTDRAPSAPHFFSAYALIPSGLVYFLFKSPGGENRGLSSL
jgi:hypothetical protein